MLRGNLTALKLCNPLATTPNADIIWFLVQDDTHRADPERCKIRRKREKFRGSKVRI
jgi:hypothetical protein